MARPAKATARIAVNFIATNARLIVVIDGRVDRYRTWEGYSAFVDGVERAGGIIVFISFSVSSCLRASDGHSGRAGDEKSMSHLKITPC
jgi:hypothetical protein